jgi:hypothetical protein
MSPRYPYTRPYQQEESAGNPRDVVHHGQLASGELAIITDPKKPLPEALEVGRGDVAYFTIELTDGMIAASTRTPTTTSTRGGRGVARARSCRRREPGRAGWRLVVGRPTRMRPTAGLYCMGRVHAITKIAAPVRHALLGVQQPCKEIMDMHRRIMTVHHLDEPIIFLIKSIEDIVLELLRVERTADGRESVGERLELVEEDSS